MRTKELVWVVLLVLAVLLSICFKYMPYLPGDMSVTRSIQAILPESNSYSC